MKRSVYIETSIISYLAARPSGDLVVAAHQKITRDWWATAAGRYRLFVSEAVEQEAAGGDPGAAARRLAIRASLHSVRVAADHGMLALRLMSEVGLPEKAGLDAVHIAIAALGEIDFLVTWNCEHIASAVFRPRIESFCRGIGLVPPNIVTPLELLGLSP